MFDGMEFLGGLNAGKWGMKDPPAAELNWEHMEGVWRLMESNVVPAWEALCMPTSIRCLFLGAEVPVPARLCPPMREMARSQVPNNRADAPPLCLSPALGFCGKQRID